MIRIFKSLDLKITTDTNLKTVNFLDVILSLQTGTHKPYRKPNDKPMYINIDSNHPPSLIRNIPKAVEKRLLELSSNSRIVKQAADTYSGVLKESGYKDEIHYKDSKQENQGRANSNQQAENGNHRKMSRKRTVIWFNPPYSRSVKTNILMREVLSIAGQTFSKRKRVTQDIQ